jgi:hypothetical protein
MEGIKMSYSDRFSNWSHHKSPIKSNPCGTLSRGNKWKLSESLEMSGWNKNFGKPERIEFDPSVDYSKRELEILADQYLRDDARSINPETGKEKGIGGDNPILFAEHEYSRRRREIYVTEGTPDPSLVSGIYFRTHPQGRKVNSETQRKKNGASYYR